MAGVVRGAGRRHAVGVLWRGMCSKADAPSLTIQAGHHPAAGWLPFLAAPDEFVLQWHGRRAVFFGRTPLQQVAQEVGATVLVVHPSGLQRAVAANGEAAVPPGAAGTLPAAAGGTALGDWHEEALTLAHTVGCQLALLHGSGVVLLNAGQPVTAGGASAGASLSLSYAFVGAGAVALLAAAAGLKAGMGPSQSESRA